MRHRKSGKKLGRNTSHRKAMMRNMVTSLFEHEQIKTTDARAKELRKIAEKLITLAKRGDLHAHRQILEVVRDKKTAAKLVERIAPRYQQRAGGYTRIIKLGHRSGDNAALSLIELVEEEFTAKPKKKKPAAQTAPAKAPEAVEETAATPEEQSAAPATAKKAATEEAPEESATETAEEPVPEPAVEEAVATDVTPEPEEPKAKIPASEETQEKMAEAKEEKKKKE